MKPVDDLLQLVKVRLHIPSGATRQRIRCIRHQSHLIGTDLSNESKEVLRGVALDIVLRVDHLPQRRYVGVLNVPFVGSGMDGDPLRPHPLEVLSHLNDVRAILAPGIPEGGDFIDIDAK